jgi:ATP-dependent DNA helicase RecQ
MTSQDLPASLFDSIAEAILALGPSPDRCEYVVADPNELAGARLAADHNAGRVTAAQSRSARVLDEYRLAVTRVIATLSDLRALTDLGDYPDRVRVLRGEISPPEGQIDDVVTATLALGARRLRAVEVDKLHAELLSRVRGFEELSEDPGATWALIVDLHALGYLDVSQAPMRTMLTGLMLNPREPGTDARAVPAEFRLRISGKAARASREVLELRRWYEDGSHCANEGLASYFRAEVLPEDTCAHSNCRCSTCWSDASVASNGEQLPRLLRALRTQNPRPASSTREGRLIAERTLDGHVQALLWDNQRGLFASMLRRVLRGEDSYFDARRQRRVPLWPELLYSRHRGASPGVRDQDVAASLARLATRGVAADVGEGKWRLQAHIDAEARRAASQSSASALTVVERTDPRSHL